MIELQPESRRAMLLKMGLSWCFAIATSNVQRETLSLTVTAFCASTTVGFSTVAWASTTVGFSTVAWASTTVGFLRAGRARDRLTTTSSWAVGRSVGALVRTENLFETGTGTWKFETLDLSIWAFLRLGEILFLDLSVLTDLFFLSFRVTVIHGLFSLTPPAVQRLRLVAVRPLRQCLPGGDCNHRDLLCSRNHP